MIKRTYHQLVLLGAFLSCMISTVIFSRGGSLRVNGTELQTRVVPHASVAGTETRQQIPPLNWSASASSDEEGWRFELFTPPPIFWDATSHSYQLSRRPKRELVEASRSTGTGLQSGGEQIDRIAPRLELLGYVQRERGEIAGIFQNLQTSEVRVVLSGSPVAEWQVMIESVKLETVRIANDSSDVQLPQARAFVRDELLGCTYPLSTHEVPGPSVDFAGKTNLPIREDFSRDG